MQDESGKIPSTFKINRAKFRHDYKKKKKIKVILEVPDLSTLT